MKPIPEIDMLHDTPAQFLRDVKIIPKGSQSAIIPNRRASALKRLAEIESDLGRLNRLVVELRADVLHLTTE